jgi:type VII secretion integral membrane protein EccD
LLAAGTGALALLVGAALTVAGLSPAGAAAVLATAALAATPLLPSIAIRLAGLPSPVVPQTPTDVIPEPARSHPDLLAGRVNAATRYLDGLFAGVTATCVGATGVLAAADTGYAAALGAVVAVALLLRADAFTGLGQHLILLTGGVVSLLAALIGIEAVAPGLVTIGALVAGLLLGVLGCVRTAWRQRPGSRPPSPYGGRLLDILEVLAVVAVVPLALAVLGVFDWVIDILGS